MDYNFLRRTYYIKDNINYGEIIDIKEKDNCFSVITLDGWYETKEINISKSEMKQLLNTYKLDLLKEERSKIILEKDIRGLVHFTKIENIEKIFESGILSSSEANIVSNDTRYEGLEEYINASISFPNYKLFYRRRMEDKNIKWCVLTIKPNIIIDNLDDIFLPLNAGSNIMINKRIENPLFYKTNEGLMSLFDEEIEGVKRSPIIKSSYPTNPQAEVLVADKILPSYIMGVYIESLNDTKIKDKVKSLALNSNIHYEANNKPFNARLDYKQWQ